MDTSLGFESHVSTAATGSSMDQQCALALYKYLLSFASSLSSTASTMREQGRLLGTWIHSEMCESSGPFKTLVMRFLKLVNLVRLENLMKIVPVSQSLVKYQQTCCFNGLKYGIFVPSI